MAKVKINFGVTKWAIFCLLLCPLVAAQAQDTDAENAPQDEIEINLEALDALSPDRETEPSEDLTQPSDILAPPSLETGTSNQPPPLTPPVEPANTGPQPQSPMAPRMTDQGPVPNLDSVTGAPIGGSFTIPFDGNSDDLSLKAAETLDKIARLTNQNAARVQLFGYAGDEKSSPSTTRRLALKRTVAVRGYLMDQGVDGTRIDLRPQGPRSEDGPRESVVIKFLEK